MLTLKVYIYTYILFMHKMVESGAGTWQLRVRMPGGAGKRKMGGWKAGAREPESPVGTDTELPGTREDVGAQGGRMTQAGTGCVRGDRAGLDAHPKKTMLSLKKCNRRRLICSHKLIFFKAERDEEKSSC